MGPLLPHYSATWDVPERRCERKSFKRTTLRVAQSFIHKEENDWRYRDTSTFDSGRWMTQKGPTGGPRKVEEGKQHEVFVSYLKAHQRPCTIGKALSDIATG